MSKGSHVIVTGASGFIGGFLVEKLISKGYSVIAISRSPKKETGQDNKIQWCNWESINKFFENDNFDIKAIFHLATDYGRNVLSNYSEIESANVVNPLKLLDLAVRYKVSKFISTDSFFSKPDFSYQHMRPYILTKSSFNEWGRYLSYVHDLFFLNVRLEHVYGPNDNKDKFIPYLIKHLKKGEQIKCTSCEQKRDFVYINDVIDAYMAILDAEFSKKYTEIQVGTGRSIPFRRFIDFLIKEIDCSSDLIEFGGVPQRENEIMDSYANIDELTSLGWKSNFSYEEGIKMLLDTDR
ncbi:MULTISPECIES: NAD-dependent epimerase/dehydratase family protein [Pectobacterium]|uniref:NAD-dependent epimerase/dehydratase family protein n=1 Tax=Pectobacterium TaxID=122277 RepID=UPI0010FE49DC|nr:MULTISPECIES: NAD(P)-dependent oxidoreductase [Pectobacterium]KAA3667415.1 NAD(P)-dependent oxidoreductase [Pectobacterium carotovorum subsp. carotovorum]MCA6925176.1 NAD(P)-dependent oxidoreductase [Pectobacterium versatile]MCH5081936.1 NAD(P)-dependent oxidoreductase [Pectobacterium versatile]